MSKRRIQSVEFNDIPQAKVQRTDAGFKRPVNYINHIPSEILHLFFDLLDGESIVKVARTCTRFYRISKDHTFPILNLTKCNLPYLYRLKSIHVIVNPENLDRIKHARIVKTLDLCCPIHQSFAEIPEKTEKSAHFENVNLLRIDLHRCDRAIYALKSAIPRCRNGLGPLDIVIAGMPYAYEPQFPLEGLPSSPYTKSLELSGVLLTSIMKSDLSKTHPLCNLQSLHINIPTISSHALLHLTALTKLKILKIHPAIGRDWETAMITVLKTCSESLEYLSIRHGKRDTQKPLVAEALLLDILDGEKFPQLKRLDICNVTLFKSHCFALASNTTLKRLKLMECHMKEDGVNSDNVIRKRVTFTMDCLPKSLERLRIDGYAINSFAGISCLCRLKTLRIDNLITNPMSDLRMLPRLERLIIATPLMCLLEDVIKNNWNCLRTFEICLESLETPTAIPCGIKSMNLQRIVFRKFSDDCRAGEYTKFIYIYDVKRLAFICQFLHVK